MKLGPYGGGNSLPGDSAAQREGPEEAIPHREAQRA